MRLYIDEFKQSIREQESELSKPMAPGLIKSSKNMSYMVPEICEKNQMIV